MNWPLTLTTLCLLPPQQPCQTHLSVTHGFTSVKHSCVYVCVLSVRHRLQTALTLLHDQTCDSLFPQVKITRPEDPRKTHWCLHRAVSNTNLSEVPHLWTHLHTFRGCAMLYVTLVVVTFKLFHGATNFKHTTVLFCFCFTVKMLHSLS